MADTVENVMTRDPECCTADESVIECAKMMENADVGMIPIVESLDTRKLIGVVTDRDIALGVVARGLEPKECTVEDCMTDEVFTVSASDPLDRAAETMKQHQVRRLPVVDENNCIIGVIAQADLVRAAPAEQVKDTVGTISEER